MRTTEIQRTFIKIFQRFIPLVFWGCATAAGLAANPYAGLYMGTMTGSNARTVNMAFLVDNNGWGAMLAYSPAAGMPAGVYFEGFTVNGNGTFSLTLTEGNVITGSISGAHLAGVFPGEPGATFSANLKSGTGIQQAAVGIYSGLAIQPGGTGPDRLINGVVAADGTFYGTMEPLETDSSTDGFVGTLGNNLLSFSSPGSGATGSGYLDPAMFKIEGNWSAPDGGGTFLLRRTRSLQGAACTYTLSPASISFGSSGGTGTFSVGTAAGYAWKAAPEMLSDIWIQCMASGSGNGTVSYTVERNYGTNWRTGHIDIGTGTAPVGGTIFTVLQAPRGYEFDPVFGLVYDAGGDWYWHSGFGWMWFGPGGWIWSSSVQGWVAKMGSSQTLWSPQFRWLTPSSSDPCHATTSTLGQVHVGNQHGTPITEGFVTSDRFGFIWPAGDGVWFYSTTYGWLGVTADGGIWCVSLGRFL